METPSHRMASAAILASQLLSAEPPNILSITVDDMNADLVIQSKTKQTDIILKFVSIPKFSQTCYDRSNQTF